MLDIKITKAEKLKEKPTDETALGFGKIFTDHMFLMDYDKSYGGTHWHNPRIEPYHPFSIPPACSVLHYAQEVFEGL
ncbi:MAG: branched chain amino acid aminotransferase, partial [Solobacterium sp.]|nr:branched chain amino acid aminotransferase [Solobacterium sp.]